MNTVRVLLSCVNNTKRVLVLSPREFRSFQRTKYGLKKLSRYPAERVIEKFGSLAPERTIEEKSQIRSSRNVLID